MPLLRQGRSTFGPSSRETTICQWIQTALPFTLRRNFFKLFFLGNQRAHRIRERLKALANFICRWGCCLLVGLRVSLWPPSTCRSCPQSHCLESLSLYCSFQFWWYLQGIVVTVRTCLPQVGFFKECWSASELFSFGCWGAMTHQARKWRQQSVLS